MLRDYNFQLEYRTGKNDFIYDFYSPAFSRSTEYCKAVGFFSSSSFETFGSTLKDFLHSGGKIKLVTSVELQEVDKKALEAGISLEKVCEDRINEIIDDEFSKEIGNGVKRLTYLVEMDRIEIKIAIPWDRSSHKYKRGIYHEKVGIFIDEKGDYIATSGSKNLSKNAIEENYESFDVFTSWNDPARAKLKKEHFDSLWNQTNPDNQILSFPEASRKKLIRIASKSKNHSISNDDEVAINKWAHQDRALEVFLEKERGVLNMATGTGKTKTSLKIAKYLYSKGLIETIIVSTFGNSLLNQWYKEVLQLRKEIRLKIFRHHESHKERQQFIQDPSDSILIVSNAQVGLALQNLTSQQGRKTLLIYDEVHRLGAAENVQNLKGLSDHIRYVLGLSATPEREYDEKGNDFIEEHVGSILMNFNLEDAIRKNILAPFNYFPLDYIASEEDKENIKSVHAQRAARNHQGNPMSTEEFYTKLANVYKKSRVKQSVFDSFIKNHQELLTRCIIFVADTQYAMEVLEYVHKYRADFHTYLSGDDEETLKRFARGDLECLVACHRLSEGIDIKSLNTVILFSSDRAKLETIQRIGRCLRTDPKNLQKVANVVDFIRNESDTDIDRKTWLEKLSKIRPQEEV